MYIKSAALMLLAMATVGHAVTYTVAAGAPDPGFSADQTLLVDFNSTTLPPGYTLTGGYGYRTGTTSEAAAPAQDATQYLYVSSALSPNSAILNTAFDLSKISFYWGSIDTYNSVDVLGAGGATLGSFGGALFPPANGDQTGSSSNERVTFAAGTGEVITGLRFTSTGAAFELDTIAGTAAGDGNPNAAIPEPAAWVMLVAGFGLVGAAARRRRGTVSLVN